MSSLEGVKPGDIIWVRGDSRERGTHARCVASVGRKYVTDDRGDQFEIATGVFNGYTVGVGKSASTEAEQRESEQREQIRATLARWGLRPSDAEMSLARQARVADLLRQFAAEDAGGEAGQ